ncbi:T9SS type A sorting domain-containing protein [Flavihumibacter sp. R14]|nr:T9SS type A sorting domain-containing protein [Flavihumibacter soli]
MKNGYYFAIRFHAWKSIVLCILFGIQTTNAANLNGRPLKRPSDIRFDFSNTEGKEIGTSKSGINLPTPFWAPGDWSAVTYSSSGIIPSARHENGFVEVNGKFYLIGGRTVRNVNIFDPVTKVWSLGAASPIELNHFQAVVYNDEIYAICAMQGSYPNEVPVANIYKYNTRTNTWATGAGIPTSRRRGSSGVVVYNNKFYIVAGIRNGHIDGWVRWVDEYNPATGTWTILPDAPVARDHFMATLINGKIYAAGGRQTHYPDFAANTIGRVDVYDIATKTWSSPTQIPTQRGAPGVAYVNGELVIAGGEIQSSGSALTVVEAYNPTTNAWQTKPSLNVGRHATQMISYQGKLYLAAGSTTRGGSGQTNTMSMAEYVSDPAGQKLVSFTLVNANNEQDIQTITANSVLNLATLPSRNLNVRANTNPVIVGRVVFALTGAQTASRIETGSPYSLFGDVNGNYNSWTPAVGNYTLKGTPYTSSSGGTAGIPLTISFSVIDQAAPSVPQVVSFTLINANNEQAIQTITSNTVLNLATLPSRNLNIRANTSPNIVGRVVFVLSGRQARNITETGAPYSLFGDLNGNYNSWTPATGAYTLKATPYSSASGGTAGTSLTINFSVVDQASAFTFSLPDYNSGYVEMINSTSKLAFVYPNPAMQNFMVKFTVQEKSEWKFLLYNSSGYRLQLPTVNLEEGTGLVSFDLRPYNVSPGIYYLKIINNLMETKFAKILIN